MTDPATVGMWTQFCGAILQALGLIPRDKTRRSQHQEDTLQAISRAYHSTTKYYAALDRGKPRDKNTELDLAQQWESASIFVREYDSTLAQRLGLKSRFWREDGAWSDEMIDGAGIQLDRVRAEGMTLFR